MAIRSEPQPALGRAIRSAREQRGMMQEELAHRADLHPTWISHLESGRKNPTWATVSRLAAALEMRVSELAEMTEAEGRNRS